MIVNKDQQNPHSVKISFDDANQSRTGFFAGPIAAKVFGKAEYQWHPATISAEPDGPIASSSINADAKTVFELPAASVTVIRGKVNFPATSAKAH